jgi:CDI immunity proteins
MVLEVEREVLAGMLRAHGEDGLAERALSLSDDELARIRTLGGYYAFSEDALALGGSMGGTRALALATIDVLDATGRNLQRHRTQQEVALGMSEEPDVQERVRDRELRRHAVERQIPADQSKRILDILDPPAWDPVSPDATPAMKRCHELRTKPLKDFTDEDLRTMIEQQVALDLLVGPALTRLRVDPLLDSGCYPGDLLASVLRVNAPFWEPRFDPEVATRKLAESLSERSNLQPELRELIRTFIRDHPHRSVSDVPD